MSISQKFTIETLTIITAVAILALVFGGALGNRMVPDSGKTLMLEQGVKKGQVKLPKTVRPK